MAIDIFKCASACVLCFRFDASYWKRNSLVQRY